MQSRVTFQGVTVTAVDDYFVYVSDPEGGANSGFRISDPDRNVTLNVGDKVDVDLMIQSETSGRLIQVRVAGAAIGPAALTISREEFQDPSFLYAMVRLEQLTVTQPEPTIEFVEDEEETRVYGDRNAAFELNIGTVSKRFIAPPFPYLRAGDLFDSIEGVLLRHEFEMIEEVGLLSRKLWLPLDRGPQMILGRIDPPVMLAFAWVILRLETW